MAWLVAALFGLTYIGMAIGRIPGLQVDRAGIALIAAVVLVVAGAVPVASVADHVHFSTLLLLSGLMVLSARIRAAGLYDAVSAWVASRADSPKLILAATIAAGGGLSAVLVNDVVVFAMVPVLCTGLAARGLDPRPHLFGLAAASNAGSAATLIGNPQNVLIGQVGGLGFWSYLGVAVVPALVSLVIVFFCISCVWRRALLPAAETGAATGNLGGSTLNRPGAAIGLGGLALLLVLFATPLPRELSALLVAALLILSRNLSSRTLLDEVDVPLLILFASLFVVTGAFASTDYAAGAMAQLGAAGLHPDSVLPLAGFALVASNTIGNVPAVILLLQVWQDIPAGILTGLAILSTLAGNLLLIGSLANLIVAERSDACGIKLTFTDHARAGIPIALLSMVFAALWIWSLGLAAA